jgi:hypothetical protein
MILLVVAGLSFCFMILPEGGSSQRIKSFLDRIRENLLQLEEIEKKKSQQIQLR